jgi:hypothetical protein
MPRRSGFAAQADNHSDLLVAGHAKALTGVVARNSPSPHSRKAATP